MTDIIIGSDEKIPFGEVLYPSKQKPLHEIVYDKDNPIGVPFNTKKHGTLVAVKRQEGEGCEQCAIYNTKKKKCSAPTMNIGSCSPYYREDEEDIIFKHVEDVKEDEV